MREEFVKKIVILVKMIDAGACEEEVREQAKKVLQLGNQIINEEEPSEEEKRLLQLCNRFASESVQEDVKRK